MKVPAAAALAVLVTGFGTLFIFRTLGNPRPGLPGLFAFTSATWGDGLVLPLMTGFLGYATRALPPAPYDRRFAVTAAVFAGALGVLSQSLWLAADHPRPNWTLPRPHHFTAAGWYHAAFVVAVCASTAALLALAVNRATRTRARPPVRALIALAAGVLAGLVFIALLALDTASAPSPAGLIGTLIALPALILTAAVRITRRGSGQP